MKLDLLKVKINCYRCGNSNHKPANCPVKGLHCHNCGKVGHMKRVCKQPRKNFNLQPTSRKRNFYTQSDKRHTLGVKTVLEVSDVDAESDASVSNLNYVAAQPTGPIKVELLLDLCAWS